VGKYSTEEEIENDIYRAYTKFHNESSSDRRQVFLQRFYIVTIQWCRDYFFEKEEDLFTDEILVALKSFMEKTIKEESNFFPYLRRTLNNARNEYYRKGGFIHIPKGVKKDFKNIRKILETKERDIGRKLSPIEEVQTISSWRQIPESKARELIDKMRTTSGEIESLDKEIGDDTGNMYDLISSKTLEPQREHIAKLNGQIFCNAVESTINSKQERTRGFIRALFTLHCIENMKDYDELRPVLDNKILDLYDKDKKKPTQKEIYMKYHPEVGDKSAEVRASDSLKKFLADLKTFLKKNNPELFE